MNLVTRIFSVLLLLVVFIACSTKPAILPNSGAATPVGALESRDLKLSQEAAMDAAKSARAASLESERVQRQIAELKSEIQKLSSLASECSEIAKKSDHKRAVAAALKAKKEAEEKKALEEAAAALPPPSATPVKGDYSKSDAPPGYYPEKADSHAPPVAHDKH